MNSADFHIRAFQSDRVPSPHNLGVISLAQRPTDIEIGAGNGRFAIRYAHQNPGRNIIAIERTRRRSSSFINRLQEESPLPNLYFIRDNAVHWLSHHMKPETVERYFILFPNPYPKKAQANKRWPVMPFMGFLIETLKSAGTITLVTNQRFYYEEAKDLMQNVWNLKVVDDQTISTLPNHRPASQFEMKFLDNIETCYELTFQKND